MLFDRDWETYVKSLYKKYRSPSSKAAPKTVLITKNKKGSVIFRIRRDEKYLLEDELKQAAKELKMKWTELHQLALDRKIKVRN